jgi:DNA-binding CsgD family transcriptional regulator
LEDALGRLAPGDQELAALLEGQLHVIALTDLSVLRRFGGLKSLLEQVAPKGEDANRVRTAVHAWIVCAATGPAGDAATLAEHTLDGLALTDDPLAFVTAATALMGAGRHIEARRAWDVAIADARRDGSLARLGLAATLRAPVLFRLGSVRAAEADAREVFDRASEANRLGAEVQMPLSWVLAPLVDALLERGEVEEAAVAVERCEIGSDLPELLQFNYLLDSLGRLRLAEGRASEGIAHLRECGRRLEAWGIENPGFVPWRATLGNALAALGEREEALELAGTEQEAARRFGVAREEGLALLAMARAQGGEREIELLREAARILEGSTATLDLARAQVDLGAALRRRGLRSDAREPLRRGLDLAQRCGARVTAERAHSELLASGARPRKLQLSGVGSLTAGERRVADLAAEGLTNRQIAEALYLTQKTVEGHLGNTFRKLDISSRTQLADRLTAGQ